MSTYEFDRDIKPIMEGKVPLPNPKEVTGDVAVKVLCYREMHGGQFKRADGTTEWAVRFFLDYGQGGQLYGSGMVAWIGWSVEKNCYAAKALTFAICEHEKVDAPGANHMRGWHPGRCPKCGLDMTVDSGD